MLDSQAPCEARYVAMAQDVVNADLEAIRQRLQELVAEFAARRDDESLSESTSEQDVHHWVDRLLEVLGWNIHDPAPSSEPRHLEYLRRPKQIPHRQDLARSCEEPQAERLGQWETWRC
jgi:hypothetical protein